jgi:hypothetical protein
MKINCLCCGHKVDLDDAYDDYEGYIKCLCGTLLEIKTEEGRLKSVKLGVSHSGPLPKRRGVAGAATT